MKNLKVRRPIVLAAVAAVTVALATAGCGGGSKPAVTTTQTVTTTKTATTTTTISPAPLIIATSEDQCTGGWTIPLTVQAQSLDEMQYLSKISACTTAARDRTLLINNTDIVWEIHTTQGGEAVEHSVPTFVQSIFRLSAQQGSTVAMEPNSSVSVAAAPSVVSWLANPRLTTVWTALSPMATATELQATGQFKIDLLEPLLPKSPRMEAFTACAKAVYAAADITLNEPAQEHSPSDIVLALAENASDLGQSAAECREKIALVDRDDATAGRIRNATLPEARELATSTGWFSKLKSTFYGAIRAGSRAHITR